MSAMRNPRPGAEQTQWHDGIILGVTVEGGMGLWLGPVEEHVRGEGENRASEPRDKEVEGQEGVIGDRAKCSEEATFVEQAEANGEAWHQGLEQQDHNDSMDSMGSHRARPWHAWKLMEKGMTFFIWIS